MNPVFQNNFEAGKGNALQACIASILNRALDEVPDFIQAPDYLQYLNRWLAEQGMAFLKIDLVMGELVHPTAEGLLLLLAGPSPRGSHRHIVVGRTANNGFECLHDPYPNGGGLAGEPLWAGFLLPLDPGLPE